MPNQDKNIKIFFHIVCLSIIAFCMLPAFLFKAKGQSIKKEDVWHGMTREIRYQPGGNDFVIRNGKRRFNRALYGTHSAFRVEAGDLPEFALYLPGMGGNFKLGLLVGNRSKWLINAENIIAKYRSGMMLYEIEDSLLGDGKLLISVIPFADTEGMLIKIEFVEVGAKCKLFWAFGGVSGKKFSRSGDIGADPESSFYLKPEYCSGNEINIENDNTFSITSGDGKKVVSGIFPATAEIKISDANQQQSPVVLWESGQSGQPVITGIQNVGQHRLNYFAVYNPENKKDINYKDLPRLFEIAENKRAKLANRIIIKTPDPYINAIGGALAMAADAIWENPSYLHGAVAWRMPLNGWRGAYCADWLGWHGRARTHFKAYSKSQYISPASGPSVPDPKTNLARQKEEKGTALFTSGYISRRPNELSKPHHYDMNLVFIDQLLRHFDWTGDLEFLQEMWPVINRHLDWETRNFDPDNDGLYSAYASIWASDALEYNGGGVAHSSAYNYLAFLKTAQLAEIIGEDPVPYEKQAQKILSALNGQLWMPNKGWYAEFKDILGYKRLHPYPALWSVYHVVDSKVSNPFQAYQLFKYVDTEIPHIPVKAEGLSGNYYTLSTSNWMPYTWSVNNVALAEVLHTSLSFWQSGQHDDAFRLWKSALLESMYLGASPGNFQQLSFYDAMRGELYRDNGDPVGMAARTLVEGLFGIQPHAMQNLLVLKPGFPSEWQHASLKTPDVFFAFERNGNRDVYTVKNAIEKLSRLKLFINAQYERVDKVLVNGEPVEWKLLETSIDYPKLQISSKLQNATRIEIIWAGEKLENIKEVSVVQPNSKWQYEFKRATLLDIKDPQNALAGLSQRKQGFEAVNLAEKGNKTVFALLSQGEMKWWEPLDFEVKNAISIKSNPSQPTDTLSFWVKNNTEKKIEGNISINSAKTTRELGFNLNPNEENAITITNLSQLQTGSNTVKIRWQNGEMSAKVINWKINAEHEEWQTIDLGPYFNDKVGNIFKNEYLSPRSPYPTLQIPIHGLGDWCSYKAYMKIDDSGIRKLAGKDNQFETPQGIPFKTPGTANSKNIVFTSLWDNYPDETSIPLTGKSSHAYLLMAGSTNPMQSQMENGTVTIAYADGSADSLVLKNPDTWLPIEQDYYRDGYAFAIDTPRPIRVHLKTGWIGLQFEDYVSIGNFTKFAIDGGAATVLDIPLDKTKELKSLTLKTKANDVLIGLMGVTLLR